MSVFRSIWSATSRSSRWVGSLAAFMTLIGCSNMPSSYEHADTIDAGVHRGSEVLAFSNDSKAMLSGGWEGEIALWSMQTQTPEKIWVAHDGPIHGLDFAGPYIVSAGLDGWIKVWTRTGDSLAAVDSGAGVERSAVAANHVVTGHRDGTVKLWTLPDLTLVSDRQLHEGIVKDVTYSASRALFASVGADRRVFTWSLNDSPRALSRAPGMVRSLVFSPDGDTLYGGGWVNLLRWQVDGGQLSVLDTDHWGLISSMQFVPKQPLLATISRINDSAVLFLDPATGQTLKKFTPQRLCGGAISLSPNGRFLSTTGDDGAVRIWDLNDSPAVASVDSRASFAE